MNYNKIERRNMNNTSLYSRKLHSDKYAMKHYKTEKSLRKAIKLSNMYLYKPHNPIRHTWYIVVNRNKYVNNWEGGYVF